MVTVVSHIRLLADFPALTPDRIPAKWAEMLKANAERINEGRLAQIPDELAFQNNLSGPAHLAFAPMIDANFVSRAGLKAPAIRAKHAVKLALAYQSYRESLDKAFATVDGIPAKHFKEQVDNRSAKFGRGVTKTLGLTGTRREKLGPAALASLWLTNDVTVSGKLRSSDQILQGGPFLITAVEKRAALKAALTERMTQAGIHILRSGFNPMVLALENNLNNAIVQGYIDPALGLVGFTTGGASHIDFQEEDGKLYLDIMASQS